MKAVEQAPKSATPLLTAVWQQCADRTNRPSQRSNSVFSTTVLVPLVGLSTGGVVAALACGVGSRVFIEV